MRIRTSGIGRKSISAGSPIPCAGIASAKMTFHSTPAARIRLRAKRSTHLRRSRPTSRHWDSELERGGSGLEGAFGRESAYGLLPFHGLHQVNHAAKAVECRLRLAQVLEDPGAYAQPLDQVHQRPTLLE